MNPLKNTIATSPSPILPQDSPPHPARSVRLLGHLVRYGIVLGVLGLMAWTFWHYRADVGTALARADWVWLGPATGLNLVGSLIYLGVWYSCARQLGATGGFRGALTALSVAGAARYIPGAIWPVVGLVYFGPRVGLPRRLMAVLAVLAQLLHLTAAGVVGLLAFGVVTAQLPGTLSSGLIVGLALLLGLGLATIGLLPRYLAPLLRKLAGRQAIPKISLWSAAGFSALFWLSNGLRLTLLILAFGPVNLGWLPYLICAGAATTVLSGLFFFVPLGLGVIELSLAGWLAVILPWPTVLAVVALNRLLRTLNDFFFLALAKLLPTRLPPN